MTTNVAQKVSLLVVISFLISGCAIKQQSTEYDPDTDAKIEKMIAAQEYGKVLEILNTLKDSQSSRYISRNKQLLELISEFEKSIISKTNASVLRGEFHFALTILENALKKIPSNTNLNDLHNKLILQRDRKLEETRINLLLVEANYDLDRQKWYKEEARLKKPSMISRWQMKSLEGSLDHLHNKLLECQEGQGKAGNHELAEQCFQAAHRIKPSKPITGSPVTTLSEKADSKPKELTKTKKSRPGNPDVTEVKSTAPNPAGKTDTKKTEQVKPNPVEQTNIEKNEPVERYMKEGASHYRAGRINQARDTWQKVLKIEKDHPMAQEQISRAEKVLTRLDNLKKSSQSGK